MLGNPPYKGSPGIAVDEERSLVEAYRKPEGADVPKPDGRGLNDLYVRFFRIAERQIAEKTGRGVVCYVSNNSWLDGSSHPAMRERVLGAFDRIWIDNLHGDSRRTGKLTPEGAPDPSAFSTPGNREGIQVGTAVVLLARTDGHSADTPAVVRYRDFWGESKLRTLDALAQAGTLGGLDTSAPDYSRIDPVPALGLPLLLQQTAAAYLDAPTLPELFPAYFPGVFTARDVALVDTDRDRLDTRMRRYFDPAVGDDVIAATDPALTTGTGRFDAAGARRALQRAGYGSGRIVSYLYRPFDVRWLFWVGETKLLDEKKLNAVLESK